MTLSSVPDDTQPPRPHAEPAAGHALDVARIRAITLDLDDTLWPVWPTIAHAEARLQSWLAEHAPAACALAQQQDVVRRIRAEVQAEHVGLAHDLGALRREAIRQMLARAGDDPALADAAYAVFLAARQQVQLFGDALPALELLGRRWPLVALSNGNADVRQVGIGQFFHAAVSAAEVGVAKPDARIFQLGAEAAGVSPGQVLHVGDDALLDAQGALDAGMQAVWLRRPPGTVPGRPGAVPSGHEPHAPNAAPACAAVPDLQALCRLLGLA